MKKLTILTLLLLLTIASTTYAQTFTEPLKYGMRNNAQVSKLQEILTNLGYLPSNNITGNFFNLTQQALIKYQKANNLSLDGQVGPQTRASLNNIPGNVITDKQINKIEYQGELIQKGVIRKCNFKVNFNNGQTVEFPLKISGRVIDFIGNNECSWYSTDNAGTVIIEKIVNNKWVSTGVSATLFGNNELDFYFDIIIPDSSNLPKVGEKFRLVFTEPVCSYADAVTCWDVQDSVAILLTRGENNANTISRLNTEAIKNFKEMDNKHLLSVGLSSDLIGLNKESVISLADTIDLTGDGISEGIFSYPEGNNDASFILKSGFIYPLKSKNKDGKISTASFLSFGRISGSAGAKFLSNENGYYAYMTQRDTTTEDSNIYKCTYFEAYKWNSQTNLFEYNEILTNKYRGEVCK